MHTVLIRYGCALNNMRSALSRNGLSLKTTLSKKQQKQTRRWDKKMEKYNIISFIGEGSFGRVFKVVNKETNGTFALKVIRKVSCVLFVYF